MFYVPRLEVDGRIFRLQSDYNQVGSQESQLLHSPIVLEHETIDGKHAMLSFDLIKNTVEILDLMSMKGTYLDGERITPMKWRLLKHGQRVGFGEVEAIFLVECTDSDLDMLRQQCRQDLSEPLEDLHIIPVSQIVQFPPEPKGTVLVAGTQDESSSDHAIADISLPETEHLNRSSGNAWDEEDSFQTALAETVLSPKSTYVRHRSIPETQDTLGTPRTFHEDVTLPETQSRPASRASPGSLTQNFTLDDVWDLPTQIFKPRALEIESQNLLGDVALPMKEEFPEKAKEIVCETIVVKRSESVDITDHLVLPPDGDDTDCEEELSLRESSKTPELQELHQTEKTAFFLRPGDPLALLQPAFVKIRRLQVHDSKNPNIYDALTQVDECEAETQRFDPEATQRFDPVAFRKDRPEECEVRNEVLSQVRLSDFSFSEDGSQCSQISTPPCAINFPSKENIEKLLKAKTAVKRAASFFHESSDEEDDFETLLSEQPPVRMTPRKMLSPAAVNRLRQINILDSPCPDVPILEDPAPSKALIKRNLMATSKSSYPVAPKAVAEPPRRSKRVPKKCVRMVEEEEEEESPKPPQKKPRTRGRKH